MNLYACDTVPLLHLESKLKYLFNLTPEVINIFVENHNPQEILVGDPPFRKKQCLNIVEIKNKIRNQFNPKHSNPDFHIPPLAKGISHEHVIHASDYEEQVDYYLKLLGKKEGIACLENNNKGLSFYKPFHIPRPRQYEFKRIPISLLLANILKLENNHVIKKLTLIEETPHYKGLLENMVYYQNYLQQFRFTYLCDDYSIEKFNSLKSLGKDQLKSISPILVKPLNENYYIIDGVHRAAVALINGYEKIDCVVFEK